MTPLESLKAVFDKAKITLAVAESASAGHLSALLASVSGASSFFVGGAVVYNIRMKIDLLGVDEEHAASCNCVSERVAIEMARGIRQLTGANVGVSVTGYAGPYVTNGIVVETPFAWIGFDVNGHVWAVKVVGPEASGLRGDEFRVATQKEYAQVAANILVDFVTRTHGHATEIETYTVPITADADPIADWTKV